MVYYFQTCCFQQTYSDNFFGVDIILPDNSLGLIYSIEIPSFSGCAVHIKGPIPLESTIYDGNGGSSTLYNSCEECIENSFNCLPEPTPTPSITYFPSNECNVITIFPMTIGCLPTNPSTVNSTDGSITISITGGTPPYVCTWSNGLFEVIGTSIYNLSVGEYTATVTDYYGDFTQSITCQLTSST